MTADRSWVAASRRSVLRAAVGAATARLLCVAAAADEAAVLQFRAVQVDTTPLSTIGGGASARLIAQLLPDKLRAAFADRLSAADKRAPVLVARIDRLYLSSYADAPSAGLDMGSNTDSMEGAGLVIAGRQIVSSTPLRVTLPAGYSGTYYLPDIDQRRIASLCDSFASWLRREMNL